MPHRPLDSTRHVTGAAPLAPVPAAARRARHLAALATLLLAAACGSAEDEVVPIDPTPPIDTTAREGMTAAPHRPAVSRT